MHQNGNKVHVNYYDSPLGKISFAYDDIGLCGLWFEGQKYYQNHLNEYDEEENDFRYKVVEWLDSYFLGNHPEVNVPLHLEGTTFQLNVWNILLTIPYGKTMTYGEIANIIAKERGLKRMSSQAVGSAVGHNPISIIVPCHRVIGSDGSLVGYAGGLERKEALLRLEKAY